MWFAIVTSNKYAPYPNRQLMTPTDERCCSIRNIIYISTEPLPGIKFSSVPNTSNSTERGRDEAQSRDLETLQGPSSPIKMDYLYISNAFPGEVFSPSPKPQSRLTSAGSHMNSLASCPRSNFAHEMIGARSTEPSGSKRMRGPREDNFTLKHGSRHHSYDPEKAPYPLSYDKEFIGM